SPRRSSRRPESKGRWVSVSTVAAVGVTTGVVVTVGLGLAGGAACGPVPFPSMAGNFCRGSLGWVVMGCALIGVPVGAAVPALGCAGVVANVPCGMVPGMLACPLPG